MDEVSGGVHGTPPNHCIGSDELTSRIFRLESQTWRYRHLSAGTSTSRSVLYAGEVGLPCCWTMSPG